MKLCSKQIHKLSSKFLVKMCLDTRLTPLHSMFLQSFLETNSVVQIHIVPSGQTCFCLLFAHVFMVLCYFYVMCMGVLSARMSVYHLHVRACSQGCELPLTFWGLPWILWKLECPCRLCCLAEAVLLEPSCLEPDPLPFPNWAHRRGLHTWLVLSRELSHFCELKARVRHESVTWLVRFYKSVIQLSLLSH